MKAAKITGMIVGATLLLYAVFTVSANRAVEQHRPTSKEVQGVILSSNEGIALDSISTNLFRANLPFEIIFAEDRRFLSGNYLTEKDKEELRHTARLMLNGAKKVRSDGLLEDSWVEYKLYFDGQNRLLKVYVFPWSKII